ncbi:hypothetical protein JOB18_015689, partial [Solea senegalensis]
ETSVESLPTPGDVINAEGGAMAHGQQDISHMYAPPHPHPLPPSSYSCSGDMYLEQPAGGYLSSSFHPAPPPAPPPSYSSPANKPVSVEGAALLSMLPDFGGFYPQSCQRDVERKSLPFPLESLRMAPPLTPLSTIRNFTLSAPSPCSDGAVTTAFPGHQNLPLRPILRPRKYPNRPSKTPYKHKVMQKKSHHL